MKTIEKILNVSCILPLLWSGHSLAQQPEAPTFVPIEVFTCNYNKGKSYGDLERVISMWNKWADENYPVGYTAWTMTPNFFSSDQDFDVVWLGAWQDGNKMGAGLAAWNSPAGGVMNAEFVKVVDCDTHGNLASMNIKPPSENWPAENGVTTFSDCKLAEGKTISDAVAAHRAIAQFQASQGSSAGSWMMFPGYGAGDIKYDYKMVGGHDDFQSLG